jgi:hypothetical protein
MLPVYDNHLRADASPTAQPMPAAAAGLDVARAAKLSGRGTWPSSERGAESGLFTSIRR